MPNGKRNQRLCLSVSLMYTTKIYLESGLFLSAIFVFWPYCLSYDKFCVLNIGIFFRLWAKPCKLTARRGWDCVLFTRFFLMRLLPVSAGLFRSAAFGGLKACKSTKNFTVSRWMNLFFHLITGIKHNFRLFSWRFYYMWGGILSVSLFSEHLHLLNIC